MVGDKEGTQVITTSRDGHEKPFVCDVCGIRSKSEVGHRRHMENMHNPSVGVEKQSKAKRMPPALMKKPRLDDGSTERELKKARMELFKEYPQLIEMCAKNDKYNKSKAPFTDRDVDYLITHLMECKNKASPKGFSPSHSFFISSSVVLDGERVRFEQHHTRLESLFDLCCINAEHIRAEMEDTCFIKFKVKLSRKKDVEPEVLVKLSEKSFISESVRQAMIEVVNSADIPDFLEKKRELYAKRLANKQIHDSSSSSSSSAHKFGLRLEKGSIMQMSDANFRWLAEDTAPKIRDVICSVLHHKHRDEWRSVAQKVLQVDVAKSGGKSGDNACTTKRAGLSAEAFSKTAVVQNIREEYLQLLAAEGTEISGPSLGSRKEKKTKLPERIACLSRLVGSFTRNEINVHVFGILRNSTQKKSSNQGQSGEATVNDNESSTDPSLAAFSTSHSEADFITVVNTSLWQAVLEHARRRVTSSGAASNIASGIDFDGHVEGDAPENFDQSNVVENSNAKKRKTFSA